MKKLSNIGLFLIIACASCFANQAYSGTCAKGGQKVVTQGINSTNTALVTYPGCTVTVNIHGAGLATIFSDNIGTPLSNPFTLGSTAVDFIWYAANGRYDVTMSGGSPAFPSPEVISDILLNDPSGVLGCSQLPNLTGDVTTVNCVATLATVATPGTGLKATINAKGLVTNITTAASTDLSDSSIIARLNATANFGSNAVSMGALIATTGTFTGSLSASGITATSEIAPSVTGLQLGDTAHRWDVFARNLDFSGSLSFFSITSTTIISSKINGFFYVDGVQYPTIQLAITAACGAGGGTVWIPPGTYAQNSGLTSCSNLNLIGAGKGQADGAGCVTTITTTQTTGDFLGLVNQVDSHYADFCVKKTGSDGTGAFMRLNYGQRITAERLYFSGNMAQGITLNTSSTSGASTIWNDFRDIHITNLANNGIACLLDSQDASNKVINNNYFWNVSCVGGNGGVGIKLTNSGVHNQIINEDEFHSGEISCLSNSGTGLLIDQGSTADLLIQDGNIEGCSKGFSKRTSNTVIFIGGKDQSNGPMNLLSDNVVDDQPLFTTWLNTRIGGQTLPTFSIDPNGNFSISGLGLNNTSASANSINGAPGWTLNTLGTGRWQVNNASFAPNTAAASDLGTTLLPVGNIFVGTAATNNNKITSAVTTGARVFMLPDANSNPVIPDTGAANNFLTGISSLGVITKAQPSFSNLSGSIALSQTPLTTNGDLFTVTGGVLARLATGTANQVLHGTNLWGNVVSADLNITTTTCTNQFLTAISATVAGTCTTATLASAQFANQGTTTTLLHGNAAGNPSFGQAVLTTDVTGVLPTANGGTGQNSTATFPASGTLDTGTGTTNTIVKFTNGAAGVIGNATPTDNGTTFAVGELLTATGLGLNGAGASANTINLTVSWTEHGIARTSVSSSIAFASTANSARACLSVFSDNSTNLTYITTVTGAPTTGRYASDVWVRRE